MAAGTQVWGRFGGAAVAMTPLPRTDRNGSGSLVLDTDAESALVARCLDGDESAWEDLVRIYTRRVYSICYRFTGRESEAQDLTQEVFLKVFRNVRSFRAGEGSFGGWRG